MLMIILVLLLTTNITTGGYKLFSRISKTANITISNFEKTTNKLGGYSSNIKTSDGRQRNENRRLINNAGKNKEKSIVEGPYTHINSNDRIETVEYQSNRNRFYAEGEHSPDSVNASRKPPEVGIPAHCVESLCAGKSIG